MKSKPKSINNTYTNNKTIIREVRLYILSNNMCGLHPFIIVNSALGFVSILS